MQRIKASFSAMTGYTELQSNLQSATDEIRLLDDSQKQIAMTMLRLAKSIEQINSARDFDRRQDEFSLETKLNAIQLNFKKVEDFVHETETNLSNKQDNKAEILYSTLDKLLEDKFNKLDDSVEKMESDISADARERHQVNDRLTAMECELVSCLSQQADLKKLRKQLIDESEHMRTELQTRTAASEQMVQQRMTNTDQLVKRHIEESKSTFAPKLKKLESVCAKSLAATEKKLRAAQKTECQSFWNSARSQFSAVNDSTEKRVNKIIQNSSIQLRDNLETLKSDFSAIQGNNVRTLNSTIDSRCSKLANELSLLKKDLTLGQNGQFSRLQNLITNSCATVRAEVDALKSFATSDSEKVKLAENIAELKLLMESELAAAKAGIAESSKQNATKIVQVSNKVESIANLNLGMRSSALETQLNEMKTVTASLSVLVDQLRSNETKQQQIYQSQLSNLESSLNAKIANLSVKLDARIQKIASGNGFPDARIAEVENKIRELENSSRMENKIAEVENSSRMENKLAEVENKIRELENSSRMENKIRELENKIAEVENSFSDSQIGKLSEFKKSILKEVIAVEDANEFFVHRTDLPDIEQKLLANVNEIQSSYEIDFKSLDPIIKPITASVEQLSARMDQSSVEKALGELQSDIEDMKSGIPQLKSGLDSIAKQFRSELDSRAELLSSSTADLREELLAEIAAISASEITLADIYNKGPFLSVIHLSELFTGASAINEFLLRPARLVPEQGTSVAEFMKSSFGKDLDLNELQTNAFLNALNCNDSEFDYLQFKSFWRTFVLTAAEPNAPRAVTDIFADVSKAFSAELLTKFSKSISSEFVDKL